MAKHPRHGPAKIADELWCDATPEQRFKLINTIKVMRARARKKGASPPPATDPRKGEPLGRAKRARRERVSVSAPEIVAIPAPVPAPSVGPPDLEAIPVPDFDAMSPREVQLWMLQQAARGVAGKRPDTQAYAACLREVRQVHAAMVAQQRDDEQRSGPASAEELIGELVQHIDNREILPDYVLDVFIKEGLRRYSAKLIPADPP